MANGTDETRVSVLGVSVDETPGGGAIGATGQWRNTGGAGGRNALNTVASGMGGNIDPVPNRAINAAYTLIATLDTSTAGFNTRFDAVVGDAGPGGGADQATFDAIGKHLIDAVAGWTHDFTNSDTWTCAHDLNSKYVSVRAVKADGTIMIPDIDYAGATDNSIVLHFVHPVTGTATIRR